MAVIPLNTFRTITRKLTNDKLVEIYSCPTGVTAIILLAQVSNVSTSTAKISFIHMRQVTDTYLVKDARIPKEDALSVLTGRLVLEEGDRIRVKQDIANGAALQVVLSIVESANT